MDTLLQAANIAIRKECPPDSPENTITVFRRGTFLQLTFQTTGCKYNARGSCSMCNYGHGKAPNEDVLLSELEQAIKGTQEIPTESILLGSSGSFLDANEIPVSLQNSILELVFKSGVPNIIIETHYKSISIDTLNRVAQYLQNRKVELEVGLETINPWLRTHVLNKDIDLDEFHNVVSIAHSFNMTITANLLLGIPFLSEAAQISDTRYSIRWALSKGVDYIIVFPVNIHPYTLFERLYEEKHIRPISLWLLFYLLAQLDDQEMEHLSISWYGNRTISYGKGRDSVPLCACDSCRYLLVDFFDDFSQNKNLSHRRISIAKLMAQPISCTCRESAKKAIQAKPEFLHTNYEKARHMMEALIGDNESKGRN